MRIALFTSQFPAKVATFFSRDVHALITAGVEVDIYPIYPIDHSLWTYVPRTVIEQTGIRKATHDLRVNDCLQGMTRLSCRQAAKSVGDLLRICLSAAKFGITPIAKSIYAVYKGVACAANVETSYDHVLSYWGNYAATSAYVFHRLRNCGVPFSLFLHAGTDLYRSQVYLREKLLYADRIILVCRFNREFLKTRYPSLFPGLDEKLYYHHLGLDLSDLRYYPDSRIPNRIIGVGSFHAAKGFEVLVRALSALCSRGRGVELELVGDGPERARLERLAERLGVRQRIIFSGWLTPEQTTFAIRRASLLVHPSIGIGDAVPTVIKEAMALGTAVVASDIAGIPELLDKGKCGVLVPSRDVTVLVEAIDEVLGSASSRRQFAESARRFAEQNLDMWQNGARLADVLSSTHRHRLN